MVTVSTVRFYSPLPRASSAVMGHSALATAYVWKSHHRTQALLRILPKYYMPVWSEGDRRVIGTGATSTYLLRVVIFTQGCTRAGPLTSEP